MLTLLRSYLGYSQGLNDDDAVEQDLDIEAGPPPRSSSPLSPTRKPFQGRRVPSRPLESDPECKLYDVFFEQFHVAPSRDGVSVLLYHKTYESEVNGVPVFDEWKRDDDPDGVVRVRDTMKIYEHLFEGEAEHPRLVRYLGPTVSGYRLERLDLGPVALSVLPPASDNDISLALYQRWSLQILSALSFLHSKGIVVNGLSNETFWLRSDLSLAIACMINAGSIELGVHCGDWPCHILESPWTPDGSRTLDRFTEADVGQPKRDLFDWAVLVYQWMTGHHDPVRLDYSKMSQEEVRESERKVSEGLFVDWPMIEDKFLGPALVQAWKGEFETAEKVLEEARKYLIASGRTLSPGREDEIEGFKWREEFCVSVHEKYQYNMLHLQSRDKEKLETSR